MFSIFVELFRDDWGFLVLDFFNMPRYQGYQFGDDCELEGGEFFGKIKLYDWIYLADCLPHSGVKLVLDVNPFTIILKNVVHVREVAWD